LTPDHHLPIGLRFGKTVSSFTGDLGFADFSTGDTVTLHDEEVTTSVYSWRANYHPRLRTLGGAPGTYGLAAKLNDSPSGEGTQLNNGAIVRATFEGQPAVYRVNRVTGVVTGGTKAHALRGVVMQDLDVVAGLCDGAGEFSLYSTGAVGMGAGVTKTGAGTLLLTGSNTYTGTTTVDPDLDMTALDAAAPASDCPAAGSVTVTGWMGCTGTLELNAGQNQFVMLTNQTSSVSAGTITVNGGTLNVAGQTLLFNTQVTDLENRTWVINPVLVLPNPDLTLSVAPESMVPPPGYIIVAGGSTGTSFRLVPLPADGTSLGLSGTVTFQPNLTTNRLDN
jgi:autotransporter-associated beta strand protein